MFALKSISILPTLAVVLGFLFFGFAEQLEYAQTQSDRPITGIQMQSTISETNSSSKTLPAAPDDKANEDKRVACGIVVTLSGSVMTAALAVLAGQVTFSAFSFDKGKFQTLSQRKRKIFLVLNLAAVILLVGSIIAGGRGVAILYKAGFTGRWELDSSGDNFEVQTDLCLAGLLTVIVMVGVGVSGAKKEATIHPNSDDLLSPNNRLNNIEKEIEKLPFLEQQILALKKKVLKLANRHHK